MFPMPRFIQFDSAKFILSLVVPNGVLNLSGLAFPRDSVEIIRESWQEEH